jgi:hypothetical protein
LVQDRDPVTSIRIRFPPSLSQYQVGGASSM